MGGGGDPLVSGQYSRIEPSLAKTPEAIEDLGLPDALARDASAEFARLKERVARDWPQLAI